MNDSSTMQEFKRVIRVQLMQHKIPTPKFICEQMGWQSRSRTLGGPTLPGEYSKVRREMFEAAGLKQDYPGARWHW